MPENLVLATAEDLRVKVQIDLPPSQHQPAAYLPNLPTGDRLFASAAYSFVRFIGGGLASYVAGRLVLALNIHVPFFIGAGAIVLGILILATAHRLLGEAERVQAEQVAAAPSVPAGPAVALIPVAPASTGAADLAAAVPGPAADG